MKFFINTIFAAFFLLITNLLYGQHDEAGYEQIQSLQIKYKLHQICRDDLEGYSEKISGGEYSYPSLREDLGQALISRATTGKMGFEFYTSTVPADFKYNNVNFFFLSDIDLNLRQPFDIWVNDIPLLTFVANADGTLKLLENPGHGKADYFLIKRDLNGDGVGAFRLTIPKKFVRKGSRIKVKITGRHKGSNGWFMIFKGTDVISRLTTSVRTDRTFLLRQEGPSLIVEAPAFYQGHEIQLTLDGRPLKPAILQAKDGIATTEIRATPPKKTLTLVYDSDTLQMYFPAHPGEANQTNLRGAYLIQFNSRIDKVWHASIQKSYHPEYFDTYRHFFDEKYAQGHIAIMNSSHQDIAWVDRPENCAILRDTLLITPILKAAIESDDYAFDIENGLMLREYVQRHPESRDVLSALLNKHFLSVGATFTCPYEDMYDAEDQVRQLYLGKKWVKKTFGGYDAKVYWNVDVPGRSLQTPQILKKAGVDYMVISRHARGFFHWQSPDGSSVFTYSPGHYGDDLIQLRKSMENKLKYAAEKSVYWQPYFGKKMFYTPLLSSQDMLPAIDYTDFIAQWNHFDKITDEKGMVRSMHLPTMELMTADEFLPLAARSASEADTIRGERPNVWLYIHGPGHHKALTDSRQASKLLPDAEKFLSVAQMLNPAQMPYPADKLKEAWQAKIYPDHGWGGHDGDITDDLFKAKFIKAKNIASHQLERAISFIASQVKTEIKSGIPVVLFNGLSWDRTDPVALIVHFMPGETQDVQVTDHDHAAVPAQLSQAEYYADGSLKRAQLAFIAAVPAIGYHTYYVKKVPKIHGNSPSEQNTNMYENKFYKITFREGGIDQVYDKTLKKQLFNTSKYAVGDVFTLQSVGNGAGEFEDVQQPFNQDFDQVSRHPAQWKLQESGPVYNTYSLKQDIRDAEVVQSVTVYHNLKRICFETTLHNWNGEMYREFRTAFPLAMSNPNIDYEVPFGKVQVGKDEIVSAGERYNVLCKNVHPRSVIDWISASDENTRVTISSSVAAMDWIDPVHENNPNILQHVLLASRRSCHWEGNDYAQPGDHTYRYVMTSQGKQDNSGARIAKQFNDPLHAVIYPAAAVGANLPEEASFFSIDQESIIISAIKKADDADGYIIRMYNTSAKHQEVALNSFFRIKSIQKTNIIEENPVNTTSIQAGPYSIETYLLDMTVKKK